MKKLFIYYSLSGNGDLVADVLSKNGFEIRKVKVGKKDELPKNTFLKMMRGGFLALLQKRFELIDFDSDVSEYDEIVIGSPIWNSRLACPINTVLDEVNLNDKRVTFILYSGSGEAKKAKEKIKEEYNNAEIINIKEPKKYDIIMNEKLKESKII